MYIALASLATALARAAGDAAPSTVDPAADVGKRCGLDTAADGTMLQHCDQRVHDYRATAYRIGAIADELQEDAGAIVARRGSDIDVEAYILQAVLEKKPALGSADKAAAYMNDLPKAGSDFAAIEDRARELVWSDGAIAEEWDHLVHARVYDLRPGTNTQRSKCVLSDWRLLSVPAAAQTDRRNISCRPQARHARLGGGRRAHLDPHAGQ